MSRFTIEVGDTFKEYPVIVSQYDGSTLQLGTDHFPPLPIRQDAINISSGFVA
jgi:hypothetical protein